MTQLVTQLFDAINRNDVAQVNELIAQGVDVNAKNKWGDSALHIASWKGDLTMFRILKDAGADINACDDVGKRTALHIASIHNQLAIVKELVADGVDLAVKDAFGYSALFLARKYDALNVEWFLDDIRIISRQYCI